MSAFALTAGTAGRPKIVVRRFDSLTPRRLELPGPLLRAERPVRLLQCIRLTGLGRRFVENTLVSGGTVLTRTDFDPGAVIATVETQRVTHLFTLPHQLRALVDHPLLATTDTSSLRWVMCTAARASSGLLRRAVERLGAVVYQSYGQTEATVISLLSPEDYFPGRWELLATCGRARPGIEITVRDGAGHTVTAGERGEVWVRTPYVMAGYLNRPDLTAQALRDGWLRTATSAPWTRTDFLPCVLTCQRLPDASLPDGRPANCATGDTYDEPLLRRRQYPRTDPPAATIDSWHTSCWPTPTPADAIEPLEAINLLIKKIKRVHGFRNFENCRLRLLMHCGVD